VILLWMMATRGAEERSKLHRMTRNGTAQRQSRLRMQQQSAYLLDLQQGMKPLQKKRGMHGWPRARNQWWSTSRTSSRGNAALVCEQRLPYFYAMKKTPDNRRGNLRDAGAKALRSNFRKIERREWWLWVAAAIITLLLTIALASFLLPNVATHMDFHAQYVLPQAVRGLVGLVFLFDLYTIYQHLQIHRIRRQLIEREELFHLISENAADMIAVVDLEGRRIFNSLSYQKILGYSPEELQESSGFEQIHPDDRERVKKAAAQTRLSGMGTMLEYRFRHKKGEWLVLESVASVIRNEKGEPEKLVIVNRDITERKKAQEALSRSEASFRSLVEGAPHGIYRATMAGQFLEVNPALQRMLGYESVQELFKADLATQVFLRPEDYKRMNDLLAESKVMKDTELEWKQASGDRIVVRCSGHRVDGKDGGPGYFEVFAEDVTEKRTLERQLRMAQKMEAIGRLSGGIAHDFNNLLGVIIGYSGVLKKSMDKSQPAYEYAAEIEKAGQRAASLTRQLLAFSRQQVLTPSVLSLNSLVSDMEKMLPRLLGEDIHVSLSLAAELGNVKADQSQIEQVIMNLAVNARDAMPSGGKLHIQTANMEMDHAFTRDHPGSKIGSYVMLAIADTGTGMSAETIAHIFEPFFTTKGVGEGTGLGLATVYGVVKQSNGYIWVDSAPGKGSTFQIYLPRHVETEQDLVAKPQDESREKPRGSEMILLVEDADPLRKLAQSFLESNGFRVLSAPNGEAALEIAARHSGAFDLLLTDVVMPGMNGRVLAEKLSALRPGLKVLFMSGYTDTFIAGHGVLEGGTYLLHKPFTEEVLISKVREVLDSAKKGFPGLKAELAPVPSGSRSH
jgi:two-component system cell cycle sensor histidine kinase/response regulator CckA